MFVETKEHGEVQQAPATVGTLKLSDAIRIGARYRPQAFGELYEHGATCALGAAIEGIFGYGEIYTAGGKRNCVDLDNYFGSKKWRDFDIPRKNDLSRWSREQIADWLESQGY